MSYSPHPNDAYTVAWISVLRLEATAARIMLDEEHGTPRIVHPQDTNSYVLGRIGPHNVVIACLPAGVHGQTSAATVVTQLPYTFSSLRFGLLVGIGGGVPPSDVAGTALSDVRLGDVVVSKPSGTSGGVVQYDSGGLSKGSLIRRGALNKPPTVLLTAMSSLASRHELHDNRIEELLDTATRRFSKTRASLRRPSAKHATGMAAEADADRLYAADYVHAGDAPTCDGCSAAKLVVRPTALLIWTPSTLWYHCVGPLDEGCGKARLHLAPPWRSAVLRDGGGRPGGPLSVPRHPWQLRLCRLAPER
jgi:hypothetical protein